MDYNTNRYFGLNKRIVSFLHHAALMAMLHSSFVAPAQGIVDAYLNNKKPLKYSGSTSDIVIPVSEDDKKIIGSQQAYPEYKETGKRPKINSHNAAASYSISADIKEGTIGVSKDKPLDNPSDNLFKVTLEQLPAASDKVYLSYEVFGVADHHSVARSINDRLSVGGYIVKKQQGWSQQKEEINPSWLKQGDNTILFTIAQGADYQYKIKNLSIKVEKGNKVNSLLVLANQSMVFSKDNKVYVKGFIRGSHPDGKVDAGGSLLQFSNNEFEGFVTLTDEIKRNGFLMIKATENNQLLGQEIIFIDNALEADSMFSLKSKEQAVSKLFKAGVNSSLDILGASITANDSALGKNYEISISRLRHIDVAPMESGMINVTKGAQAYRFLPDGAKFEKTVSLSIAYDSKLIPTGYTEKDVKTYYFDRQSKRWVAVHKDSIDVKNSAIISKTIHFTDYINGIVQAPDSPESSAFTPTMMSDIKSADPSAEMTLVSPPSASQKGDATINYPIKLPSGRRGMQPQLGLQYSSEGGNGWLGDGWSLNVPAITLDTRWGTPLFDQASETEIYSLNGEQLMYKDGYLPHRHRDLAGGEMTTDYISRNTGGAKLFFPRKQGSFAKIERLGNTPQTYYWKVTNTDGTIYWYGGKGSVLSDFVIKDDRNPQNIVHWALYMIEDVYGNNVKYTYQTGVMGNNIAGNPGLEGGRFFEIQNIYYTGKDGADGNYRIDFEKETSVLREDLTIDARLGVKRVSPYRLINILINYLPDSQNPLIRKYSIAYETGKLGKSRPASITESSGDNQFSYTHTFEYYNDITQDGVDVYFGSGINTSICIEGESDCPDNDNDGICNGVDACPDVFGSPANSGCPEPETEHCFRVNFYLYKGKPVHIKFDGVELLHSPYILPANSNELISDIAEMYGYTAQIEQGDPITLFITGTGTMLSTISTSFDADPNNFAVTNLPFNNCMGGRPGNFTTFGIPSGSDNSYHSFYDQVKNNFTIGFSGNTSGGNPNCPWLINYDFLMQGYMPSFISAPAALGSSKSESFSFGAYVGVGVGGNFISKPTTFGGQYTYGWDKGLGYLASVDITGDGLEDIVIKENDQLYYKKHNVTRTYDAENNESIIHSFEEKRPIQGVNNFYRTNSESNSFNFQVTFKGVAVGGFGGLDHSNTKSETDIYFTDANGDGLMDIVRNEVVYFNYINNGVPKFEPDSWKTENLVITAKPKNIDMPAEYLQQEINYPQHDIVKVWEAPANGTIKITNNIELTDISKEAVATIEMSKKYECYKTEIEIPAIVDADYVYILQAGISSWFDYFTLSIPLPVYSYKLNYIALENQIYNAPPNFYYTNGNSTGCINQNPPFPFPDNYINLNPYTGFENPSFEADAKLWLSNIFGNNLIKSYTENHSSIYNQIGWSGVPQIRCMHDAILEVVLEEPVNQLSINYSKEKDCLAIGETFNSNSLTSTHYNIIGLNTFVLVNGVQMPGVYNLYENFNQFKSAFESMYPNSFVEMDTTNGNDIGKISITTDDGNILTVEIIHTDSSVSNIYYFDSCDSFGSPQNKSSNMAWKNIKPSKSEKLFSKSKIFASDTELNKPIIEIPVHVQVSVPDDLSGFFSDTTYFLTKLHNKHIWKTVNEETVEDKKNIEILESLLPHDIQSLYDTTQSEYTEMVMQNREHDRSLAIAELKKMKIEQKQLEYSSENYSLNPQDCAPISGDLCLLFGEVLNSENSIINNTISNYSTYCESNQGAISVRKGDKIYFRVHSLSAGNAMINWNPAIEYTASGMTTIVDQNGETPFSSQYSNGYILSGTTPLIFPGNGIAEISWPAFTVSNPSDEVTYEIYKKELTGAEENYNSIQPILIYQRKCFVGNSVIVTPQANQIPGSDISSITVSNTSTNPEGPKATLFYFKVTSTSNVRWKQWQWRPKVVCITKNTIVDENQSSQGTATFNDIRYPIPDYSIYKSFPCSTKYNLYKFFVLDIDDENVSIQPNLSGISFNGLKGNLYFVVKQNGNHLGKRIFSINNNNISIDNNNPISLPINGEIEIGYYSDDSALIDIEESLLSRLATSGEPLAKISYTVTGSTIAQLYKQNVNLFHKPFAKFGPMYRQWGQFAYNPAGVTDAIEGPYGPLIKEESLMLTDENSQALQDAATTAESQFSNINLDTDYQSFINNMNQFEADNQQLFNVPFIPLTANRNLSPAEGYQEKWQGLHAESYARETSYRAATMDQAYSGMDDGDEETEQDVLKTGAYAITRYSKGEGTNLSGGVSFSAEGSSASVGVSGSKSINGSSNMLTDYVDLNGDRYPDLVSTTHIQYTTKTGGLTDSDAINAAYNNNLADYGNSSWGIGASGSVVVGGKPASAPDPTSKRPQFSSFKGNNSVGISGNYSSGSSHTKKMWVDVNGDGMADLLTRDALTGYVTVKMNMGDSRLPMPNGAETPWASFKLAEGRSSAVGGGIGGSLWNGSVEFGASINRGNNHTDFSLTDMNGDGLVDLVTSHDDALIVRLNRGGNFAPEVIWSTYNLDRQFEVVSMATNAGGTLAWIFGIPFTSISLKLIDVNVNGSPYSTSTNNTKKSITDYDGDGYPDLLEETSPGTVRIRPSNIRRTDMLKSVINPLGGKFTVDYKVITPSYGNPDAKWVLKSVVVEDGYDLVNDGADIYSENFEYENGYYDRREREFYGYETVKKIDNILNEQQEVTGIYRTSVSVFHNKSYYLKGMMKESYMMRGNNINQLFSKTVNTYKLKALDMNSGLINLSAAAIPLTFDTGGQEGRKAAAVLLDSTDNYIYEFGTTPLVSRVEYTYDDTRGRITKYDYKGNVAVAEDNYITLIGYYIDATLESKNIYNVPRIITVQDHTTEERRRRFVDSVNPNTGDITSIWAYYSNSYSITDMTYDQYGNLSKVTLPPNENGQRFSYDYHYDADNHKLPVLVSDSFGYESSTVYDFSIDKPIKTRDIAGNEMTYDYDSFGRVLTIRAPKENYNNIPYTISFGYYPKYSELVTSYNCVEAENFMPVAVTSHYDAQHPGNDIQTYTFVDGLGRAVQVKKDIEINTGDKANPNLIEAVSVSGKTFYDQYGRVNYQFHPYFENKDCALNLVLNEYDSPYASVTGYDVLDRPDYMVDPEGNATYINYAISGDYYNIPSLKTTTTIEQNGSDNIVSQTIKDINGRVTATVNILHGNNAADLWTRFGYNSLGELTSYTDAENITTIYKYYRNGLKAEMIHPDNGHTIYDYDLAGNMTKIQTANLAGDTSLQPNDRYIKYHYDYNRLRKIVFPNTPSGDNIANVDYVYGDSGNETGRITEQFDATGAQYFHYGNMGEMISNTRIVVGPNIPTREFTTAFTYDSWNRINTITYPDGEAVTHQYNLGGNLVKITGVVNDSPYDYVQRIDYDYFEQKTYQLYGNGTDMIYEYTPSLRRLNTMVARTSSQVNFLDNIYNYDKVGNVTRLRNNAAFNSSNFMSGEFEHNYTYDNVNRLTNAIGNFTGDSQQQQNNNDYQSDYVLDMSYNMTHGIAEKRQVHNKNNQAVAENTYDNFYKYHEGTHKVQEVGNQTFKYDKNGNITDVNISGNGWDKKMYWDESNRLRVIDDKKNLHHYIYDATGERILKASAKPESLYNNGMPVDGDVSFDSYTTYPSAYIVINPDGKFSKHYYVGSQRIVSRVSDEDASIFDYNKRAAVTSTNTGTEEAPAFDEDELRQQQIGDLTRILEKAEIGAPSFQEYETGGDEEPTETEDEESTGGPVLQRGPAQAELYFYHPDHLGTSTFLTDANGELYQFFLNLPFGETMAEQHSLTADYETPYKFNGKELDTETGLYYYGARYYDPRTSIWLSTDPLMEKYPNVNPYAYCIQNPINYTDPTGMAVEDGDDWYRNDTTGEVTYVEGSRDIEGHTNLTQTTTQLDEVVIEAQRSQDRISCNPIKVGQDLSFDWSWFRIKGGTTIWGSDRSGDTGGLKGITDDSHEYDDFVTPSGGGGKMTFWFDQTNIGIYGFKLVKDTHGMADMGFNFTKGVRKGKSEIVNSSIVVKQYTMFTETKTFDSIDVTRTFRGTYQGNRKKIDSTKANSKNQRRTAITYFD